MCLIVCSEADKPLSLAFFENVMKRNKDGFGLMATKDNKMLIKKLDKASSTPEAAFAIYDKYKEHYPILHFRMRTHGEEDAENTHPFYCGYGIWMMHNGVIHNHSNKSDSKMSDTWHFVKDILKPLFRQVINPHKFFRTQCFATMIQDYIGSSNRIILMDRGGAIRFNDSTWYTVKDKETGFAGTVVSNQYAWDETFYKPKVSEYNGHNYGSYGGHNVHIHGSRWNYKTRQYEVPGENDDESDYNAFGFYNQRKTQYEYPRESQVWKNPSFLSMVDPLYGDWYVDGEDHIWRRDSYGFVRSQHMDDNDIIKQALTKLKDAKAEFAARQIPLDPATDVTQPALPAPVPHQLLLIENNSENTPEDDNETPLSKGLSDDVADFNEAMNKQMHRQALVREWRSYKDDEINTLVYADPDEAAEVLCSLLRS